jgi:hypothetical protein
MSTPVNRARAFLNSGSRNRQRAIQLFNAVLNSENPNNSVMNRLANIITPAAPLRSNRSYSVRSYVSNSNSNNEVTSRAPRYTATQPNIHPEILRQARRTLIGNFNTANTNLNRLTREARRLERLNLNTFGRNNRSKARSFITAVINAHHGNENSLRYALSVVNNVKRIGGGNIPLNKRQAAQRAATTIQKYARGMAARKRATARRSRLVRLPNGTYMVAAPIRRRR